MEEDPRVGDRYMGAPDFKVNQAIIHLLPPASHSIHLSSDFTGRPLIMAHISFHIHFDGRTKGHTYTSIRMCPS